MTQTKKQTAAQHRMTKAMTPNREDETGPGKKER